MSEKFDQSNNEEENFDGVSEKDEIIMSSPTSPVEIGYLTSAILDYYDSTSSEELDISEKWKSGTEYESGPRVKVPKEIDEEIKKAFLCQIKKFQI